MFFVQNINNVSDINVVHDTSLNIVRGKGFHCHGIEYIEIPRKQRLKADPFLEKQQFITLTDGAQNYSFDIAISVAIQIVLQNCPSLIKTISICGLVSETSDEDLVVRVKNQLDGQPLTVADCFMLPPEELSDKFDILVLNESLLPTISGKRLEEYLTDFGFILFYGELNEFDKYEIIFKAETENGNIYLLRPSFELVDEYAVIEANNVNFSWVNELKNNLKNEDIKTIYLHSQKEINGLLGFSTCVSKEVGYVRSFILDETCEKFDINKEFFKQQIKKNLITNIFKQGNWGTVVHFPFEYEERKEVFDAAVSIATLGDIKTMGWIQTPQLNFW